MSLVIYRVMEGHRTKTMVGEEEHTGSIYHRSMDTFTGLITRTNEDGTHDIVIFPPNSAPRHISNVEEGEGPGSLSLVVETPAKKSGR